MDLIETDNTNNTTNGATNIASTEELSLSKKTAVITGITSDIGMAVGNALQKQGWQVMGLAHDDLDMADLEAVATAGERLREEVLKIDALIHVAGVWHYEKGDQDNDADNEMIGETAHSRRDLEDFGWQEISKTMNVGVTGFMVLTAKLIPNIARDGCIIGVSGTFDLEDGGGASGWLPYYTSKRALEDFIHGLAQDYPQGPFAYGVSPADTATTAYAEHFPDKLEQAQPPEVIGSLIATLVTPSENYKSGGVIAVRDGHVEPGFHV